MRVLRQQIAVGPNKRHTVGPCGSTDSFYSLRKCHSGKLGACLQLTGEIVAQAYERYEHVFNKVWFGLVWSVHQISLSYWLHGAFVKRLLHCGKIIKRKS